MIEELDGKKLTEKILSSQNAAASDYEHFVLLASDLTPNEEAWIQLMHWSKLYASEDKQLDLASIALKALSTPALWLEFIDLKRACGATGITELLAHAYEETKYHYADNRLWTQLKELTIDKGGEDVIETVYLERLTVPHSGLDDTLTEYSQFVTQNFSDAYDEKMANASKIVARAKMIVNKRDFHELKLSGQAVNEGDFIKYLRWASRQKFMDLPQLSALHERAVAQFPWFESFWLGYMALLNGVEFEALAHRAILACPNGVKIWQKYVKQCNIDFSSAEAQKLLALKDPAFEHVKASYFEKTPLDHRPEVAKRIAKGKGACTFHTLGLIVEEFNRQGQSSLSLDILYSRMVDGGDTFVSQVDFWRLLVGTLDSANSSGAVEHNIPDVLMDILLKYPGIEEGLDNAAGRFVSDICEAEDGTYNLPIERANDSSHAETGSDADAAVAGGKELLDVNEHGRKRSGEHSQSDTQESALKRRKVESINPKRDREHLQVTVSDLPENCSEKDIHELFHDCGDVVQVTISDRVATVEFKEQSDCLAALTKDHKRIYDTEIRVQSAESATLWVTNFPAAYTRDDLTKIFSPYGHVLDIRIPTQHVKARRFCYVQYAFRSEASAAVLALHTKQLDGHELIVKVSDPSLRQARSDDANLIVKKIDFAATENEIRDLFTQFGTVENLKLPNNHKGENKLHDGYAFVNMGTAAEARTCIEELDGKKFKRYELQVTLASNKRNNNRSNPQQRRNVRQDPSKTVKVFNVSETADEGDIEQAFGKQGKVVSVHLNRTNHTATVEFEDAKQSGKAELALEGTSIAGKAISFTASRGKPTMFIPRSTRKR